MLAPWLVPPAERLHAAWSHSINGWLDYSAWRARPGGQPSLESLDTRHQSGSVHLPGLSMPNGMEAPRLSRESSLLRGKHPQGLYSDHRVAHGRLDSG